MKWMLNVSQDAEKLFFMRASFIHLTKLPTAHSSTFYKDNVDDETQPDDAKDELEIPTIPTVPTIPTTTTVSREFIFSGSNL